MIVVQLHKEDLISLVKGSEPTLDQVVSAKLASFCDYSDQYGRLTWKNLERLDEITLYAIYQWIKTKKV